MRIHRKCCGLEVHKKMIAACLLTEDAEGNSVVEKRLFGTMTRELHALAQWWLDSMDVLAGTDRSGCFGDSPTL